MGQRAAEFRDVFSVGEFRMLWLAETQSRLGDQVARIALALLVFDRTSSAALTALVYALSLLPPLLTAPLLAGLADRYSRRNVMVVVDLVRAALVAAMAIPALPLPVVAGLVVAATCPQPLFSAARNATLPNVLTGDRFAVGMGIIQATDNLAQVVGFTAGGAAIAIAGSPHLLLLANAATFALSAAMVRWGIRPHRPTPATGVPAGTQRAGGREFLLAGLRLVLRDRRLLGLASLIWLYGLYLAPEALAVPYAHQIRADDAAAGVLMASLVIGTMLGNVLVTRIPPGTRQRLTAPLAVATGLPLLATVTTPSVPVTVALWVASGVVTTYMLLAQVSFTQRVPDAVRGRAIGFVSAGHQTAQGLGVLLAGGLAEAMSPSIAIAVCAAVGSVGTLLVSVFVYGERSRPATGRKTPRHVPLPGDGRSRRR
ncbi:MFS transporter [Flindersiella endophytica]